MKKIIFIFLISFISASATMNLSGNWHSYTKDLKSDGLTIEDETLTLNPQGTFNILLLVSVKKGVNYVKELRITVNGLWKERLGVMVFVVKNLDVPSAKKIYGINPKSLENIANVFKNRYRKDSIWIRWIVKEENNSYSVNTEEGATIIYKR